MAKFSFPWNPFDPTDPGPCIKFSVARPVDEIQYGKSIGLEYPDSPIPTALIDTGSAFTIVNTVLARTCNLFLSNPKFTIKTMKGDCDCEEYCGSLSFPTTGLPGIPAIQILAREFKETSFSCIIGRNVLKQWDIRLDGLNKIVTIVVPDARRQFGR